MVRCGSVRRRAAPRFLPQGPAQWAATAVTGLASLAQFGFLARYGGRHGVGSHRIAAAEPYVPPALHPPLVELSE
ncbi:hypothetical protein QF030_000706 [Streptomyces rishiriensis]|uniref:Uncharacterized protein n=1 Tax=Streptomyces rishiriensis TaxID=68264 RepID=A0ABU0NIH2_STRRH|nr:hypothetical protein [Streptomyces rishiriensis]